MNSFKKLWLISLFIKLILITLIPFLADEAYYWLWGFFPDWSYFDHPPMVGWLMWVGQKLNWGGQSVRWPAVVLGHISLGFWASVMKSELKIDPTFWLGFVLLSPFLGLGSLVVTPDLPLLFFWSLSFWLLHRALRKENAAAWWDYAILGLSLGLGFVSKYHIVLFVPCLLLGMMLSPQRRKKVQWRHIPWTIIFGFIGCFPVLYWNYRHEWSSFLFQLHHGLNTVSTAAAAAPSSPSSPPDYAYAQFSAWKSVLMYLIGQLGLIFPAVLWVLLSPSVKRENQHYDHIDEYSSDRWWWLSWGWTPILFFFLTSFRARVEANWSIMAYPALYLLAVIKMKSMSGNNRGRLGKRLLRITQGVWAFASVLVLSQAIFPWWPGVNPQQLKTGEALRFAEIEPRLQALAMSPSEPLRPFFASSYQMASLLTYQLSKSDKSGVWPPQIIFKLGGMNRRDFFDDRPEAYPNRQNINEFYLAKEEAQGLPAWISADGYRTEVMTTWGRDRVFQILKISRGERLR